MKRFRSIVFVPVVLSGVLFGKIAVADVWQYIIPAQKLLADGNYDEAAPFLDKTSQENPAGEDKGVYLYLRGELLRGRGDHEAAYLSYVQAAELLSNDYYLSETYWRMAQFNRDKDRQLAVKYARRSAELAPANEWRQLHVGDMFMDFRRHADAAAFFEAILANENSDEQAIVFARQRLQPSRKFWITNHLFANNYSNNDYLYESLNEIRLRVYESLFDLDLYFQANAVLDSRFSGTYFGTWSGQTERYRTDSSISKSLEFVVGARVNLLAGFDMAVDQVIPAGEDVKNETRAHLRHFWGMGHTIKPMDSWFYFSVYGEATYSFTNDDITALGDIKDGYAVALGANQMIVPYIGAFWEHGGNDMDRGERWVLEIGPGVFFRKWYRNDSSFFDLGLQYRFGLSKNRNDVLALTLSNYF